jgi:hypothetical protein
MSGAAMHSLNDRDIITDMKYICTIVFCLLVLSPVVVEAKGDVIKQAFGMNMHLRNRIPESDWDTVMDKAVDAGVQWGREEFSWDVIEPSDDLYTWDAYDAVVDAYEEHDVQMLGLLTYSSSWASSNPSSEDSEFYPPDVDAWADYVGSVAARYAGRVDTWEIWNEPNHDGFWKGELEDYAELLEIAADAIRAANPDARIVLGGLSGSDRDFLDELYSTLVDPSIIDVVAIHPYRVVGDNFNYAPEVTVDGLNTLTNDIYNIKAVMRNHGQEDVPLWLTEVGWTTASDGVSEETQARYLIRLYTAALSIPDVRKVFWYDMTDTSEEDYSEAHFGVLRTTYSKKVSYAAYRYASQHLNRRWFKDRFLPEQTTVDDFATPGGWEFSGTECTNGAISFDDGRMNVSYDFTRSTNCYAPVHFGGALPNGTRAVQFRARGDDDDTFLRVRVVDATGETFQYNLGYAPSQWLFYDVQLGTFSTYWGGDGDGKLDQPLTFDSIVLDDTDGSFAEGTMQFDDVVSSTIGNIYLYRFHKGGNDIYAYWSVASSPVSTVNLLGAGRVRIKKFQQESTVKESGNALYRIRAKSFVKFLQTL